MDTELIDTDPQPPAGAFETSAIAALVLAIVLLTAACAVIALMA